MTGEEIAARARATIGARFRPQGRDVRHGLDCIGMAAHALGLAQVPSRYSLRGGSSGELERELGSAGLIRAEEMRIGDVAVMRPGAGQLHLGIWTGDGLVHADAGLRRVVERPGPLEWPVIGIWRVAEEEAR